MGFLQNKSMNLKTVLLLFMALLVLQLVTFSNSSCNKPLRSSLNVTALPNGSQYDLYCNVGYQFVKITFFRNNNSTPLNERSKNLELRQNRVLRIRQVTPDYEGYYYCCNGNMSKELVNISVVLSTTESTSSVLPSPASKEIETSTDSTYLSKTSSSSTSIGIASSKEEEPSQLFTQPMQSPASVNSIIFISLAWAIVGITVIVSMLTVFGLWRKKKHKCNTHSFHNFCIPSSPTISTRDSIIKQSPHSVRSTEVVNKIETVQTQTPMNVSNGTVEEEKNNQMASFKCSPDSSLRLVEQHNHLESNNCSMQLVDQEINSAGSRVSLSSNVGGMSIVSSHEDGNYFDFTTHCSTVCNV